MRINKDVTTISLDSAIRIKYDEEVSRDLSVLDTRVQPGLSNDRNLRRLLLNRILKISFLGHYGIFGLLCLITALCFLASAAGCRYDENTQVKPIWKGRISC